MLTDTDIESDGRALASIATAFCKAAGGDDNLRVLAAQLIRQAIDEVIDAPRTGRLILNECEKTEKTYLGTKIEILFRSALKLRKGKILDLTVGDEEVDIKHSVSGTWMIPQEAVGRVCLLIGEKEETAKFNLGLLMCRVENLSRGRNQDKKFPIIPLTHPAALGRTRFA